MIFEQFYLESLGHASYLVGDEATGQALLLDPRRDVDAYFGAARRHDLRLTMTVDTHGHNDYLSGISELKARGRIEALGFHEAKLGYDHRAVKDGETLQMGDVAFEVIHTPGHTPEHLSLLVYDTAEGDEPALMLSGGALLVGDLARPDLLGGSEDAKEMARAFCHTIQEKILWRLPDHLEVFPTHVAGSLCGGNIGSRLSTTLGYERKTNAILARVSSSEEFVEECMRLDNLPAVPPYWRRMRSQNMAGPPLLGILAEPPALQPDEFLASAADGAVVIDCRDVEGFAGGHIPGALNVGLGSSFPTWAGTVLEDDARVLLVVESPDDVWDATWELLRIGYDVPVGWLAGGMSVYRSSGKPVDTMAPLSAQEVGSRLGEGTLTVLDVRQPAEWAEERIPGAVFITGAELPSRLDDVPQEQEVVVVCGSGFRSSVAASLLNAEGVVQATSLIGGMGAWRSQGLPLEKG